MQATKAMLIVGLILVLGPTTGAGQTTGQQGDTKSTPAKLIRKIKRTPGAQTAIPPKQDKSPPVLFQQEPSRSQSHDHDHDHGKIDDDLAETVRRLLQGPEDNPDAKRQHPLQRVGKRMRQAENRIAQIDAGKETQRIQTAIVGDLDALIAQLKKQAASCSKCNGKGCSQCQQLGRKQQQGQRPGQPNNSGKPGPNQQANNAARQAGKATPKDVVAMRRADLVKDVWGHLPLRLRQRLEQMSQQIFLPQYETLIERYYQALAEQAASSTSP